MSDDGGFKKALDACGSYAKSIEELGKRLRRHKPAMIMRGFLADTFCIQATSSDTDFSMQNLTVAEFVERFERPRLPVVITGLCDGWKARGNWTEEGLLRRYGEHKFKVCPISIRSSQMSRTSSRSSSQQLSLRHVKDLTLHPCRQGYADTGRDWVPDLNLACMHLHSCKTQMG